MTEEKECLCQASWDALGCPLHGAWRPPEGVDNTDYQRGLRDAALRARAAFLDTNHGPCSAEKIVAWILGRGF